MVKEQSSFIIVTGTENAAKKAFKKYEQKETKLSGGAKRTKPYMTERFQQEDQDSESHTIS